MAGPVINPDGTPPEASASSMASAFSPCQRLWARYHSGPESDKVAILEELIQHGCLERTRRSIAGPEIPVT